MWPCHMTGRIRTYWAMIGRLVSTWLTIVCMSELPRNIYWFEKYRKNTRDYSSWYKHKMQFGKSNASQREKFKLTHTGYIENITSWREEMNFMFKKQWTSEILVLPREHRIHTVELTSNVLLLYRPNDDGVFDDFSKILTTFRRFPKIL